MRRWYRKGRSRTGFPDAEVLDFESPLPPAGKGEGHLGEDRPPIVERDAGTSPRNGRRQCVTETQSISEGAEGVQSDVGHDAGATGFHDDTTRAVAVHFGSALLFGDCWVSTTTVSPTGRAFPRTRRVQLSERREELGLARIHVRPPARKP